MRLTRPRTHRVLMLWRMTTRLHLSVNGVVLVVVLGVMLLGALMSGIYSLAHRGLVNVRFVMALHTTMTLLCHPVVVPVRVLGTIVPRLSTAGTELYTANVLARPGARRPALGKAACEARPQTTPAVCARRAARAAAPVAAPCAAGATHTRRTTGAAACAASCAARATARTAVTAARVHPLLARGTRRWGLVSHCRRAVGGLLWRVSCRPPLRGLSVRRTIGRSCARRLRR